MFFGWWCNIRQVSIEYSMWYRIKKRCMHDDDDWSIWWSFTPFFSFVFINDQSRSIVSIVKDFYYSQGRTEVDKLIYKMKTWTMMLFFFFLMIGHYISMHLKNQKHVHIDHISHSHRSLETCCHIRFNSILLTHIFI